MSLTSINIWIWLLGTETTRLQGNARAQPFEASAHRSSTAKAMESVYKSHRWRKLWWFSRATWSCWLGKRCCRRWTPSLALSTAADARMPWNCHGLRSQVKHIRRKPLYYRDRSFVIFVQLRPRRLVGDYHRGAAVQLPSCRPHYAWSECLQRIVKLDREVGN